MVNALSSTSTFYIPKPLPVSSCQNFASHAPKLLPLSSRNLHFQSLKVKAAESTESSSSKESSQDTKKTTLLCPSCEGNGMKLCKQCEGSGVNGEDHFNGRFKAGGLCWLCRGRKEILCGDCNGAGFLGGFLSTFDETAM